ncbi:MAG: hypothetical protein R3D30_10705 [Hyphomicrobiales bacterium]
MRQLDRRRGSLSRCLVLGRFLGRSLRQIGSFRRGGGLGLGGSLLARRLFRCSFLGRGLGGRGFGFGLDLFPGRPLRRSLGFRGSPLLGGLLGFGFRLGRSLGLGGGARFGSRLLLSRFGRGGFRLSFNLLARGAFGGSLGLSLGEFLGGLLGGSLGFRRGLRFSSRLCFSSRLGLGSRFGFGRSLCFGGSPLLGSPLRFSLLLVRRPLPRRQPSLPQPSWLPRRP